MREREGGIDMVTERGIWREHKGQVKDRERQREIEIERERERNCRVKKREREDRE